MTIIISPDSFKGSLSASEVCSVIESAANRVLPDEQILLLPMADGGEGTTQSLVTATNGTLVKVPNVQGPLGQPLEGYYGVSGDQKTAIIELAVASGLDLVPKQERDAGSASTYGTGQLIRHAIEQGIEHFIIGLGGSATTDGGTGLLKALGFEFKDASGKSIPDGGKHLHLIKSIDDSLVDPRVKQAQFSIASDVTNPLVGTFGATVVFGPQKGADPELVKGLDHGLSHYATCIEAFNGKHLHDFKGAGAAGGTAAGLLAFLDTELKSGIELIKEAMHFNQILEQQNPQLIITGEGQLDSQTGYGKVISGVCQSARRFDVPVIAIAGAVKGDAESLFEMGLTAAFGLAQGPLSIEESMENTKELLYQKALQIFRVWSVKVKQSLPK